jgi:Ca-activated chloride channel family protein
MADIHLLRPLWLLALLPWAFIISQLFANQCHKSNWSKLVDPHLLTHLLNGEKTSSSRLIPSLIALFGVSLIIILSGPSVKELKTPAFQREDPLVLAVDLSNKMLAQDLKPSRMARAQFKLNDLLGSRHEGQTALVAFSGDAFVASPLSSDANTLKTMIDELGPEIVPIPGQNIKRALLQSADLIKQAGFSRGRILLVTAGPANKADMDTAKMLSGENIHTSVLAIGTPEGAPIPSSLVDFKSRSELSKLDEKSLKRLARQGGGDYSPLRLDNNDLKQLLKTDFNNKAQQGVEKVALKTWVDNARLLLFFLLPFALYAFRRGFVENYL